jgi:hypothetical protein
MMMKTVGILMHPPTPAPPTPHLYDNHFNCTQ